MKTLQSEVSTGGTGRRTMRSARKQQQAWAPGRAGERSGRGTGPQSGRGTPREVGCRRLLGGRRRRHVMTRALAAPRLRAPLGAKDAFRAKATVTGNIECAWQ